MGKLILWIVIVFAILFALRLWNTRKARRGKGPGAAQGKARPTPELMVRCANCGVFLPQVDARATAGGYLCTDPGCAHGGTGSGSR